MEEACANHELNLHNTVLRKTLRREQMVPFFMRLQPCVVAMEACGSVHTGHVSCRH